VTGPAAPRLETSWISRGARRAFSVLDTSGCSTSEVAESQPAVPQTPTGNCDPAYPTVCIPPSPPDLDYGDITYRRFTVLPPDPHRFDGSDDDRVGCESG
jgi:hypothetical protein